MTGKDLLFAMTDIEELYIQEAADIQPRRKWPRMIAAAGFFLALVGLWVSGSESTSRLPFNAQPSIVLNESQKVIDEQASMQPLDVGLQISMEDIHFNMLDTLAVDKAMRYLDTHWLKSWTYKEVLDHYTPMLDEIYIPDGLQAMQSKESRWQYFQMPNGEMVEDTVRFGFYHDYYEDGSPKLTEDIAAVKGFVIAASRTGIVNCCVYMEPETAEVYTLNGVEITFGKRILPYGPYDSETHVPSGYYAEYTAEFQMNGAQYEITTSQLEPIEVVRIAASLVCGGKGYTVE